MSSGAWQNIIMRRAPTTPYEWNTSAYHLSVPIRSLFGRGITEGAATPFTKTMILPTSLRTSTEGFFPEMYMSLGHYLASGSNFLIHGAVTKSLTLSCDGGSLKSSAQFLGRTFAIDGTITAAGLTIGNYEPLLWRNAVVDLDDTSGNNRALDCKGFSLTIDSGCTPVFGNGAILPYKILAGKYAITGSLTLPYEAKTYDSGSRPWRDFVASDAGTTSVLKPSRTLRIYWGTATATAVGQLGIQVEVLFGRPTASAEDETMSDLPFTAYATPSAEAISVYLADGVETV